MLLARPSSVRDDGAGAVRQRRQHQGQKGRRTLSCEFSSRSSKQSVQKLLGETRGVVENNRFQCSGAASSEAVLEQMELQQRPCILTFQHEELVVEGKSFEWNVITDKEEIKRDNSESSVSVVPGIVLDGLAASNIAGDGKTNATVYRVCSPFALGKAVDTIPSCIGLDRVVDGEIKGFNSKRWFDVVSHDWNENLLTAVSDAYKRDPFSMFQGVSPNVQHPPWKLEHTEYDSVNTRVSHWIDCAAKAQCRGSMASLGCEYPDEEGVIEDSELPEWNEMTKEEMCKAGSSNDNEDDSYLSELSTVQEGFFDYWIDTFNGNSHYGTALKEIKESVTSFKESATALSTKQDIAYLELSRTESSLLLLLEEIRNMKRCLNSNASKKAVANGSSMIGQHQEDGCQQDPAPAVFIQEDRKDSFNSAGGLLQDDLGNFDSPVYNYQSWNSSGVDEHMLHDMQSEQSFSSSALSLDVYKCDVRGISSIRESPHDIEAKVDSSREIDMSSLDFFKDDLDDFDAILKGSNVNTGHCEAGNKAKTDVEKSSDADRVVDVESQNSCPDDQKSKNASLMGFDDLEDTLADMIADLTELSCELSHNEELAKNKLGYSTARKPCSIEASVHETIQEEKHEDEFIRQDSLEDGQRAADCCDMSCCSSGTVKVLSYINSENGLLDGFRVSDQELESLLSSSRFISAELSESPADKDAELSMTDDRLVSISARFPESDLDHQVSSANGGVQNLGSAGTSTPSSCNGRCAEIDVCLQEEECGPMSVDVSPDVALLIQATHKCTEVAEDLLGEPPCMTTVSSEMRRLHSENSNAESLTKVAHACTSIGSVLCSQQEFSTDEWMQIREAAESVTFLEEDITCGMSISGDQADNTWDPAVSISTGMDIFYGIENAGDDKSFGPREAVLQLTESKIVQQVMVPKDVPAVGEAPCTSSAKWLTVNMGFNNSHSLQNGLQVYYNDLQTGKGEVEDMVKISNNGRVDAMIMGRRRGGPWRSSNDPTRLFHFNRTSQHERPSRMCVHSQGKGLCRVCSAEWRRHTKGKVKGGILVCSNNLSKAMKRTCDAAIAIVDWCTFTVEKCCNFASSTLGRLFPTKRR